MIKLRNKENYNYVILLVIIIIGALVRLKGFDKFGFNAADEYYIIKSVKNILERGIPEFATGGYYTRGILYQYLSAGLILLGIKDVTALRIIPLICNIFSIPVVYLIAKKVTNNWFALFAAFLFTFSLWEIEISRLARFYAPFQFIFLLYIYLLLEIIVDDKTKNYKWLYLLSILGLLIHEEGIFLIVLNFLPYYLSKHKSNFILTAVIFIAGASFTIFDFRNLGVTNNLPLDVLFPKDSSFPVYIPNLLILQIISKGAWLTAFLVPFIAFIYYVQYFIRKVSIRIEVKFYFILIGIAALLNLFGLAIFIIIFLFFSKKLNFSLLQKKEYLVLSGFLSTTFIYYVLFSFINRGWTTFFYHQSFSFK